VEVRAENILIMSAFKTVLSVVTISGEHPSQRRNIVQISLPGMVLKTRQFIFVSVKDYFYSNISPIILFSPAWV